MEKTLAIQKAEELNKAWLAEPAKTIELNKWWQAFAPEELQTLVLKSINNNLEIQEALTRLKQARQLKIKVEATKGFSLNYSQNSTGNTSKTDLMGQTSTESHRSSFTAGYELDVWGRLQANINAANLDVEIRASDLEALKISFSAETANRWIDQVKEKVRRQILTNQVERSEQTLKIVTLRFIRNQASLLDINRQNRSLKSLQAEFPRSFLREKQSQFELDVLLGNEPQAKSSVQTNKLPKIPFLSKLGLKSELILRRPDLISAKQKLIKSGWKIKAADKDRLPRFNLTVDLSSTVNNIDRIFRVWLLRAGGNIAGPLLDSGSRKAEIRFQELLKDENWLIYRRTLLNAMKEIEGLLVESKYLEEQFILKKEEHILAEKSVSLARKRYVNGTLSYIDILNTLTTLDTIELSVLDLHTNLLKNRIAIYRALSGSWLNNEIQKKENN